MSDQFVFTIFFSGTGANHRDRANDAYPLGELIAVLADHHQNKPWTKLSKFFIKSLRHIKKTGKLLPEIEPIVLKPALANLLRKLKSEGKRSHTLKQQDPALQELELPHQGEAFLEKEFINGIEQHNAWFITIATQYKYRIVLHEHSSKEWYVEIFQEHSLKLIEWTIIDGPGSYNLQEADKWVEPGNYSWLSGNLWGKGWDENVAHGLSIIKGEFKRDTAPFLELQRRGVIVERKNRFGKILPDVVNLVGWSRGGIECHMLAHAIAADQELKHIQVNIFAVDPVPGPNAFSIDKTSLPSNVNRYMAVYAEDERTKGFEPIIPSVTDATTTLAQIISFPGKHSTLVGNANNYNGNKHDKAILAVGKLVRDLAEKFLIKLGTKLEDNLNLSNLEILNLYDQITKNKSKFVDLRHHSILPFPLTIVHLNGDRMVFKGPKKSSQMRLSDVKGYRYPNLLPGFPMGMRHPLNLFSIVHGQQIELPGLIPIKFLSSDLGLTMPELQSYLTGSDPLEQRQLLQDLVNQGTYINWHHKQTVLAVAALGWFGRKLETNKLEIAESLSSLPSKQTKSTCFPHLESDFNYALSEKSILLNGMEVIFDQPIPVSPVTLQPKITRR